jgi:hypothetical protein
VKAQKGTLGTINKEIHQIEQRKEKIIKDSGDSELEIKKLEHEVAKIQSESKERLSKVRVLAFKFCYWCVTINNFNINLCHKALNFKQSNIYSSLI